MSDGEIGVTGIEVVENVKVRLKVLKNLKITNPSLINNDYFTTIASVKIADEALVKATKNMNFILKDKFPFDTHRYAKLGS